MGVNLGILNIHHCDKLIFVTVMLLHTLPALMAISVKHKTVRQEK